MKFSTDKKSVKAIIGALSVGLLIAAVIVFWREDHAAAPAEHGETEKGEQHKDGKERHAEDEGLIKLSVQQIEQAGVKVATAGPASISNTVQLPGEVRFNEDRTAHIVPRIAGIAESVTADLGQSVKKGQVLATIASPELADLRSASLAADKRLGLARLTYEREKKLWEDKISAEQDYLQAQQALREAEIAAQSANSKLTTIGAAKSGGALNRYVLRAPFDGIVVEKHITQGESVKEDANVFMLSDLSTVWVEVAVTPKDIDSMRVGEGVTIKATATESTASGKISYVGSLVGEQTRTATARAVIANPNMAWRPGLFVNVAAVRGQRNVAVAVQADAIQTVEDKTVVFLKVQDGFRAQPVKVGGSGGQFVEIADGLKAGQAYAAAGSFVLKAEQGKSSAEHEH